MNSPKLKFIILALSNIAKSNVISKNLNVKKPDNFIRSRLNNNYLDNIK